MISLGISAWIQAERLYFTNARERNDCVVDRIRRQNWRNNVIAYLGFEVDEHMFWGTLERYYLIGLSPRAASFELAEIMRIYRGYGRCR